jgi:peptidoglycan/LPS O-acetylase OafA/YrhL
LNLHRPTLGILALLLLSAAAALTLFGPRDAQYEPYTSACLRVGVVLAVLWLALPDTRPLKNRLLIAGIVLAAVVFVVRPGLILLAIKHPVVAGAVGGTLFLLKFLRPRRSTTSKRSARKSSPARESKND